MDNRWSRRWNISSSLNKRVIDKSLAVGGKTAIQWNLGHKWKKRNIKKNELI